MRKILYLTILIVVAFGGCSSKGKAKVEEKKNEKIPVVVEPVRTGVVRDILYFTGDVKGIEEVDVFPKVGGKLIKNLVEEGNSVKKDQVLALVDRDLSGVKYEPLEILSPTNGIVAKVYLDKGAVVVPPTMSTTMGTPIVRVVNMKTAKVVLNVGDRDYPKVKVNQQADIIADAYPDKIFKGRVNSIAPVINPYTKTASVEILIPNENLLLRSGMFVEVRLIVGERNGIVIENDSIIKSYGKKYVFVNDNGIAKKREIKTGIVDENKVEVVEGLKEGESIVTTGAEMLFDGAVLDIKEGLK